jgi:hypothetical protein
VPCDIITSKNIQHENCFRKIKSNDEERIDLSHLIGLIKVFSQLKFSGVNYYGLNWFQKFILFPFLIVSV